jgi:hypothetical protein
MGAKGFLHEASDNASTGRLRNSRQSTAAKAEALNERRRGLWANIAIDFQRYSRRLR